MNPETLNFNFKPQFQEQNKTEKSKQEIEWKKIQAEVEKITDSLGLGIDEKIKEAVVAFRAHGFTTSQSCEGHIKKEKKEEEESLFPWIEIYAPEPKNLNEAKDEKKKELEYKWMMENLKQQQKMMNFLAEFYQKRKTPFDAQLTFRPIGAFGGFRVQSFGAEIMKLSPKEEQLKKLDLYRKEINDFTNFLKNKFLSKK